MGVRWSPSDGPVNSAWPAGTFVSHTNRLPRRYATSGFENHPFFDRPVHVRANPYLCALAPTVRKYHPEIVHNVTVIVKCHRSIRSSSFVDSIIIL